jgi:hypothetical protein
MPTFGERQGTPEAGGHPDEEEHRPSECGAASARVVVHLTRDPGRVAEVESDLIPDHGLVSHAAAVTHCNSAAQSGFARHRADESIEHA